MKNNLNILILILVFVLIHSAKAEDTIPKPMIFDTLVISDGEKDSITHNFIKWKLDSVVAYKKDFFYEDIKAQSISISFLSLGFSKHLHNFNNLNSLYLTGGLSLGLPKNSYTSLGIPISINYLYGDYHLLELSLGYFYSELSKRLGKKFDSNSGNLIDIIQMQYGRSITFDLAYRQQYSMPRMTTLPLKEIIFRIGISNHYQLNKTDEQNKTLMHYLTFGLGLAF